MTMINVRFLALLALGTVACESHPTSAVDAGGEQDALPGLRSKNGTRLSARYLKADGTAPLFIDLFDAERQVHCRFRETQDGPLRCVPEGMETIAIPKDWAQGSLVVPPSYGKRVVLSYIESEDGGRFPAQLGTKTDLFDTRMGYPCQVPSHTEGKGFCLPVAADLADSWIGPTFAEATCPPTSRVAVVFDLKTVPVLVFDTKQGVAFTLGKRLSGCGAAQYSSFQFFEVGERLPDDAVARVSVGPQGTLGLKRYMVTEQGAAEPITPLDRLLDEARRLDCTSVQTPDEGLRCLPTQTPIVPQPQTFADQDCKTFAFVNGAGTKLGPLVAFGSNGKKGRVEAVYRMSAGSLKAVFEIKSSRCGPATVMSPGAYWAAEEKLPWSSFESLKIGSRDGW